jgi:hypothetical protein
MTVLELANQLIEAIKTDADAANYEVYVESDGTYCGLLPCEDTDVWHDYGHPPESMLIIQVEE